MKWYKDLCLKLDDIPEDVWKEYKLHKKATPDGWVYDEVHKGMYGLSQTELLEKKFSHKVSQI